MRLLLFFCGAFLAPTIIFAGPQQKVQILSGKGIVGTDDKGQTDSSSISGNGQLTGNFKGNKGAGKYSASGKDEGGGKFVGDAIGTGGQKERYTIDKNTKDVDIVSDKNNKIKADATNPKQIVATVDNDPRKTYDVNRPSENSAIVVPQGGGKQYQINGLKNNDNVDIIGGPYPVNSKYQTKTGPDGKPIAINTRQTDTFSPGNGNVRDVNTLKGDGVKTDGSLTMSNKFGKIDDPLSPSSNSLLNPSATITQEHVEAQPCVGDSGGNDMLGPSGFKVIDRSISVEYPKTSDGTYKFPDCFTIKARLQIPPNVDIKTVGAEAIVYAYPEGTMQCDTSAECKDPSPGKPTGPCFFCDFCKGDTKHKFGNQLDHESNVCSATASSSFPLSWKVCPPQGGTNKYSAFKNNLFTDGSKGDVDVVVQIFQLKVPTADDKAKLCGKSANLFSSILAGGINPVCSPLGGNSPTWVLVGCRKSRLSYKLTGSGAIKALGSAKELSKGLPFGKRKRSLKASDFSEAQRKL